MHWGGVHTTLSFTRYDLPGIELGAVVWVIWGTVIIFGTANSVNLTDGLDGLAAGSAAFVCGFLALVGFVQYRHPGIYAVHSALDLALVAMSMGGACVGFLWWNAAPARIIMGDTGSLAIGTGLACLGLVDERAAAPADHRRLVRHRDDVGGGPSDQLQGLPPARVPHGTVAPPLRAEGVARDDRHRTLLDLLGPLRGPRRGPVLRGLPLGEQAQVTRPAEARATTARANGPAGRHPGAGDTPGDEAGQWRCPPGASPGSARLSLEAKVLFTSVAGLCLLGLPIVLSASAPAAIMAGGSPWSYEIRQCMYMGIGVSAARGREPRA